ncbi:MAG: hypothetical protein WD491_14325 [Balneolales bacterium]
MALDKPINFTREAFFHPGNIGFLFFAMLVSIAGGGDFTNLVLSIALGLELLFLGIIPRSTGYQKKVRLKKMRERNSAFGEQELFDRLDQAGQKRFLVLKHISGLIKENFDKMSYTTQGMLENIHAKIQGLLSSYIINLEMLQRYNRYLSNSSKSKLQHEVDSFSKEVEATESEKLKEIKSRRLAILHKRLDKIESAREKYSICETQLETIEDTIRYIYEKSITMTNPDEIGFQLDNLINDLEETATMMEDLDDDLSPTFSLLQKMEEMDLEKTKRRVRS